MTENKHYLVSYSTGMYDDFQIHILFVTEDEELAKKYCEKFNSIRERWFGYYKELLIKDSPLKNWERAGFLEINKCFYKEIEKR